MLDLTSDQQTALQSRRLVMRTFVWVIAKDPDTGDDDPRGFWNDVGTVTVDGKDYIGSGSVGSIQTLSAKSDLSIPGLQILLSGINSSVNSYIRSDTIGQAPITVSIGLFDPDTRELITPLIQRFVGVIDEVDIDTPESGGLSNITFTCESIMRATTVKSTDTRSPESQKLRSATDQFMDYTAGTREQPIYFGRKAPRHKVNKRAA